MSYNEGEAISVRARRPTFGIMTTPTERLKLRMVGLDCVRCSLVIQRALEGVRGVRNVGVSYMLDLVLVDFDPGIVTKEQIVDTVRKTGYDVVQVAT